MTIAIGLTSNYGILIAADSLETRPGYTKKTHGKIVTHVCAKNRFAIAIAGAGTSDYLETARERATKGVDEFSSVSQVAQKIEANLLEFFDVHLARWAYFPENERPAVELLIGITGPNNYPRLYHCTGTAFHQVKNKAIGSGVLLADSLIQQFSDHNATPEVLASFAIHVVKKVKDRVDGCGGWTHLVALGKNGDFAHSDKADMDRAEAKTTKLDSVSTKRLKGQIAKVPIRLAWYSDAKNKLKRSKPQTLEGQP